MKFVAIRTRPALTGVGQNCVRHRIRHSRCQACVEACHYGAITLIDGKVQINNDACVTCGGCLFVCPASAIDKTPPLRHYRDNCLVMPLSPAPPSINELMMWHAEYHVRAVECDMAHFPGWVMAIAALNLRLKTFNEPPWAIHPPPVSNVDNARRHWLPVGKSTTKSASITPDPRARRAYFFQVSEYHLALDIARCTLCGACARICSEDVIQINHTAMTLDHTRCTGCGCCEDSCLSHAVTLTPSGENRITQLPTTERHCSGCHRSFFAWSEAGDLCPICQRHHFGMREA